jgi:hypothetical protein
MSQSIRMKFGGAIVRFANNASAHDDMMSR